MKKILIGFLLTFYISYISAQAGSFKYYRITNAGGTVSVPPSELANTILVYCSSGVTLTNNYILRVSSAAPVGVRVKVLVLLTSINLNGHYVSLFGQTLYANDLSVPLYFELVNTTDHSGGVTTLYNVAPMLLTAGYTQQLRGDVIIDGTLPLSALEGAIPISDWDTLGRGRIIRGGGSNVAESYNAAGNAKILIGDGTDINSKSVSGDVSITNAGVVAIDSVIVDADIKTGANIKWQKLATGTASYVAVTNSSGVLTTEQYLNQLRGGTGINTNSSTGFATVNAGTWAVGAMTDSKTFSVSLDTTSIGDVKVLFPFACTVTGLYAEVTKTVEASNNATITPKNNAGTTMTSGALTITAGTTIGTAFTSTPSANNVFTAGQIMTLTVAKSNAGGAVLITVTYTRTQ